MSLGLLLSLGTLLAAAPERSSVVLWHSYTRGEREGLEKTLDLFRQTRPGFEVESSFVPFDALADKLTAAIPRGHGPDLFIFAHDRLGGWAEGQLIEPIELFVTEEMLDRHATPCVFALAYGSSLFGLPLAQKALALFVRTDRAPQIPKTFDELLEIAKAVTDRSAGRYGLVYPNADLFFHTPLLFSLGGSIFPPNDPTRPNVVNDGVKASFALARRLSQAGILPDDPNPIVAGSMFSEGRTALVVNGPWFRSEIDPGTPYTVVPIPAFPGGQPSSGFSTCEGVIMSRYSTRKKEAFRLMDFLANDLRSAAVRMTVGRQTVTLNEAWNTALTELDASEQKIFSAFREAFERSTPSPSHPSMNAVWTPMNAALYKVIHKDMPPDEAMKEAQQRIEKALRSDS